MIPFQIINGSEFLDEFLFGISSLTIHYHKWIMVWWMLILCLLIDTNDENELLI